MGFLVDTLHNLVSGLGTGKDATTAAAYGLNLLDGAQAEAAYRGDWIARKVVNIPPYDATREWRAWQASKNQITALEDEEKKHGLQKKVCFAWQRARLYGGAAIIIGTGDGIPEQELKLESIQQGGLKYLHCLSKQEITCGEIQRDMESPWFGQPAKYTLQPRGGLPVDVHPSRVVRFVGAELPDPTQTTDGWGDSVLQALDDAVKNVGLTTGSIATVMNELKVDVLKIPDLMEEVSSQAYRTKLLERLSLSNTAKSTVNALLIDKDEEWQRITASLAGVPDVLRLYLLIACGAADIPATRFLGQSAAGLNASGDNDVRNYYDMLASLQKTDITPLLGWLDEVLIHSATGGRDKAIHYNWNPLWQMTQKERAEVAKAKADTFKIDVDSAVMDEDVLRTARENQLIEDGTYPGLEKAIADAPENTDVKEPDVVQGEIDPKTGEQKVVPFKPKPKTAVGDAQPRTLYVRRQLMNAPDVIAHFKAQGFKSMVTAEDMHVTIAFSRDPVDWMKIGSDYMSMESDGGLTVPPGGARLLEKQGPREAVVLMFTSSAMAWRHRDIVEAGASWDWPEYQPHVTLTYEGVGKDFSKMEPYRDELIFGPEIFEEVQEDWAKGISEDGVSDKRMQMTIDRLRAFIADGGKLHP